MEPQSIILNASTATPHLLITAGVHGDELEPMAAVRALGRAINPQRHRGRLTLVPCVNEPAFHRNARTADDGLDLARVCPGDATGTISHRVAAAASKLIRSADYYIDLHTGGMLLTLYPLAGYMLHADNPILQVQRRMAAAMGLPLVWGTSAALQGRTLSVARDAAIPAIYAEFGGGGTFNEACVEAYVAGCVNVLIELGMYDGDRAAAPVPQRVIEDARDRAGVLQIQHPSPADGFFAPEVSLGHAVAAGQRIGSVVGLLGEPLAEIRAAETGIVIMLRAWRHVSRGDALVALASTDGGDL